jgi:hypothetical protein
MSDMICVCGHAHSKHLRGGDDRNCFGDWCRCREFIPVNAVELTALQAEVQRLRGMVERLEWCFDANSCPVCHELIYDKQHKSDCELAALLAEGKDK